MQNPQPISKSTAGFSLDLLEIDKQYLIHVDAVGIVTIEEVRQACNYIKAQNLYRNDRLSFKRYIKSLCALPKTKDCLEHLFKNSKINNYLLNICRFKGHAVSLSWTTVQTFSELLSLVPIELTRVLDRLAKY